MPLPTEVDNHAYTIYASANCIIEYFTGEECSMSPFLDELAEQNNI